MSDFTSLNDPNDFYDAKALLARLSNGILGSGRQIVFVVGSALTAPRSAGERGVPGVDGVIDLIGSELADDERQDLARKMAGATNKYQDAFHFLLGSRGPQTANQVIRKAVASARLDAVARESGYELTVSTSDDACRGFEADPAGWHLTPGVKALGELAVGHPTSFGRVMLTTNFDPLIGVAITAAGGVSFRTILHRDGNIGSTEGDGSHIVYLHGYWYGSDTLHTPRQLNQDRPQLQSSLANLLRNQIVVVLAYGGWDDAFTRALVDVVVDDNAFPEVVWCFRDEVPRVRTDLLELLRPGIDRGRISFYGGVDCHEFLPALVARWDSLEAPVVPKRALPLRPSREETQRTGTAGAVEAESEFSNRTHRLVNTEADRPPVVDYYVGRSGDLSDLEDASFRVGFITGIGGQGKSALAATLYSSARSEERYDHRLWRDCKEQSDKFEDHIINLIEALNDGRVLSGELSRQSIEALADLFCTLTKDLKLLVIFDNVDHYVDLERSVLVGAAGAFVTRFLSNESAATIVFTCRPSIVTTSTAMYAKRLEGLDLEAAEELFNLRQANVSRREVEEAHDRTQGHAFWLDLLAAQVAARSPTVTLQSLLGNIASGGGEIPDATLRSIWQSLRDREQIVLQALAEALRPASAITLADYLQSRSNFNQTSKALRVLRSLNLLVVKRLDQGEEGFELHPVIRTFIHRTFKRSERVWFIDKILSFYDAFFGTHLSELSRRPTAMTVGHWLEGAELCVNAGHYERAFQRLSEVRSALRRNASPVEFVRVTQGLLSGIPTSEWREYDHFDAIFTQYHRSLVNLGRLDEARTALELYEETLEGKDARYINFCDMQTYMYWMNGDYLAAIKWGTDGARLKQDSGVDTEFSSDHNLALAERDSGAIDPALEYFLGGTTVNEVLDPSHYDKDRGGTFYGNVGRCLQLMGQIDPALICYGKSAQLIEKEHEDSDIENQAYIRQWIAELLNEKGEDDAALFFFTAALGKWRMVSPPKAGKIERVLEQGFADREHPGGSQAEHFVMRWIKAAGSQA